LKAVKELHYWDTFGADERAKQVAAFRARLAEFRAGQALAEAEGLGWQAANMARRAADMEGLLAVVEGDRAGDARYAAYLTDGAEGRLVADITPNYAVLPDETLARMAGALPGAKVLYLIRDPLARLWSHARMQAQRFRQAHEVFEEKANNILWRILHRGQETHILARGDYPGTVARLRRAVPRDRLRVEYCEAMFTAPGWTALQAWLGIELRPADGGEVAHEGPRATLRDDLRAKAVRLLRDHYDWAAREVGPLPPAWQATLERALA